MDQDGALARVEYRDGPAVALALGPQKLAERALERDIGEHERRAAMMIAKPGQHGRQHVGRAQTIEQRRAERDLGMVKAPGQPDAALGDVDRQQTDKAPERGRAIVFPHQEELMPGREADVLQQRKRESGIEENIGLEGTRDEVAPSGLEAKHRPRADAFDMDRQSPPTSVRHRRSIRAGWINRRLRVTRRLGDDPLLRHTCQWTTPCAVPGWQSSVSKSNVQRPA